MTDRSTRRAAEAHDRISQHAIKSWQDPCYWRYAVPAHAGCTTTIYEVAQSIRGSKAHRMIWTWHTASASFYRGAVPACGSRRTLGDFAGYAQFADAVTCLRCQPVEVAS